jgi:nucleoside-diphosphate-sugar epimerase
VYSEYLSAVFAHDDNNMPAFLVTGATGWVGRSVLHELQKLIPAACFNDRVYAFGSKPGTIFSTAYLKNSEITIPIYPLLNISSFARSRKIYVIHSAFLTKDRLPAYGYSSFVDTNRWITETICNALSIADESRVVEISSGAAALSAERGESCLDAAVDLYGFLKHAEEQILTEVTVTQVFRIYALSGRFIRDPLSFALGDFLISALNNSAISLNARGPVIRGYANASDVAKTALSWLMSQESSDAPISTITHTVSLKTLAAMITSIFQLPPFATYALTEPPNSYSDSPLAFLDKMFSYCLTPMTLEEQILDTATGLSRERY